MRWLLLALALSAAPAHADPAVPVPEGYRQDEYRAPVPDTVPGAQTVHTAELQALLAAGPVVLIDVLPAPRRPDAMRPGMPWLPAAHRTLPGSLWWPEVGRGVLAPEVEARFFRRLREVAGGDPPPPIVFFCLPDCWMSWNAARRAATAGFHVAWYPEGVEGWAGAGLSLQDASPELFE